jgi:excisionase family DNA binding protein
MTQKWLTLAQAVAYCGRSASTLKRKAMEGRIVGHKPDGSQWQFDRESIDAFFTPPINKRAVDIVRSLRR